MSSTDRFVNKLSVTASLVLAVTLLVTLAVVFWPRVANALGLEPARPVPGYVAGQQIDVPAAWYERAPKTLILFARASCGACQNAQPFLKTLAGTVLEYGGAVLVAGHRETPRSDSEFARSLGLGDDAFAVFPAGLRLRVTPTLVLVDRTGAILEAWEGVGPPEKQATIAAAVAKTLQ